GRANQRFRFAGRRDGDQRRVEASLDGKISHSRRAPEPQLKVGRRAAGRIRVADRDDVRNGTFLDEAQDLRQQRASLGGQLVGVELKIQVEERRRQRQGRQRVAEDLLNSSVVHRGGRRRRTVADHLR